MVVTRARTVARREGRPLPWAGLFIGGALVAWGETLHPRRNQHTISRHTKYAVVCRRLSFLRNLAFREHAVHLVDVLPDLRRIMEPLAAVRQVIEELAVHLRLRLERPRVNCQ